MQTVDVVIPTYNQSKLLLRAIKSAMDQSHPVKKIFVVDDGSDFRVRNYLEKYLADWEGLEIIESHHTGHPGHLRARALERCNSNWVAFLDADDYWHPEKIARQLKIAAEFNSSFLCSNARVLRGNLEAHTLVPESKRMSRVRLPRLLFSNPVVNSSVLVRRELLDLSGGYAASENVRGVEDYATWLRSTFIHPSLYLPQELVYYTYSGSSLSRRDDIKLPSDALLDFASWLKNSNRVGLKSLVWQLIAVATARLISYIRYLRQLQNHRGG